MISKSEVDRILKIAKNRFRSKKRVNKIMLKKVVEVDKEIETILQFLEDNRYEVNLAKVDTPPKVHVQDDTSTLDM